MKKKPNKIRGQIMAGIGFVMILANALNYLLNWGKEMTPLFIIGLVFVVIGMNMTKGK
ncbi:hypothetical protein ACFLZZ_00380 [Nanoarchaeota archaeon]